VFLANRRLALLFLCLAGMEAAWATPFWLLIYAPAPPPWAAYGLLLAWLLAWTMTLELLSRAGLRSPLYDLLALGLMAVTSLLVVRVVLYRGWPLTDLGWFGQMVRDVAGFSGGFPPVLGLMAANLFLWQRATVATSRDPSFFNVGVSFRLGMLLLIAGAALLAYVRGQSIVSLLWIYFALGLTAVAIARISEKAAEAQSAGTPFPMRRFAQLLLAVGLTVGGARLLSSLYTPDGIRHFLRVFDPLWELAKPLVYALLLVMARLLNPLFLWIDAQLAAMLRGRGLEVPELTPIVPTAAQTNPFQNLPAWLPSLLLDVFLVIGIVVAVIAGAGLLILYLEHVRKEGLRDEAEEEGSEPATLGGGILGRGMAALRNMAGMIRRFGLGPDLLAAVSVQNIYANLCRLARRRGHPRRPAQPPDDYLPVLVDTFGGCEEQLDRITAAYMRVHYGDHPVTMAELSRLREDYRAVQESESTNQRMSA
jgi:hypothetical protein